MPVGIVNFYFAGHQRILGFGVSHSNRVARLDQAEFDRFCVQYDRAARWDIEVYQGSIDQGSQLPVDDVDVANDSGALPGRSVSRRSLHG